MSSSHSHSFLVSKECPTKSVRRTESIDQHSVSHCKNSEVELEKVSKDEHQHVASLSLSEKPTHVRQDLWEKYLTLEKRTDDSTRKSTTRRINVIKANILKTVSEELTTEEDRNVLKDNDVLLDQPVVCEDGKRKGKKRPFDEESQESKKELVCKKDNSEWKDVQSYLNINDHLTHIDRGKAAPKTRLEVGIDEAVSIGDFDLAEQLSDDLATRNFGEKVAKAFDARDYAKKKKVEAESDKKKKKNKLYWGFNQKQNWEMKSNM